MSSVVLYEQCDVFCQIQSSFGYFEGQTWVGVVVLAFLVGLNRSGLTLKKGDVT